MNKPFLLLLLVVGCGSAPGQEEASWAAEPPEPKAAVPVQSPPDADEDGVPDTQDVCPGGDDKLDTDLDTVPDACDICPKGDDRVDSDEDGIPDACEEPVVEEDAAEEKAASEVHEQVEEQKAIIEEQVKEVEELNEELDDLLDKLKKAPKRR